MQHRSAFSILEMSIVLVIVGLMIAGVTGASLLLESARFSKLRKATSSSVITSMKDLTFWIEASSDKSFVVDIPEENESIAAWNDINPQTTSRINLVQVLTSLQPTYKVDIDKLPYIDFDGSEEIISASVKGAKLVRPNESTFFAVQKYRNDAANITLNWFSGAVGSNQLRVWGDTNMYWDSGDISSGGRILAGKPANFNDKWSIVTMVRKLNDDGVIRVNGTPLITSSKADNIDVSTNANLSIGSGNGSNFLNGGIREIILFKRELRQFEIDAVEQYLSDKWNIALN